MRPHSIAKALSAVLHAALLLALGAHGVAANKDKTAPKPSPQPATKSEAYDAFQSVRSRNIFDPKRKPVRAETAVAAKPASPARPNSNSLSLTGTMVTDTKSLAFFSGENGAGSKVLTVGDSVSHFKIIHISATQVELEHSGQTTTLPVGKQITTEGSVQAALPPPPPASPAAEAPATPPADASASTVKTPPAAPEKNDVLRRMQERRDKEMSK